MSSTTITVQDLVAILFKGNEKNLREVQKARKDTTRSTSSISTEFIEPIIDDISKNAGQEMDACYVGYLIEYSTINPNSPIAATLPDKS